LKMALLRLEDRARRSRALICWSLTRGRRPIPSAIPFCRTLKLPGSRDVGSGGAGFERERTGGARGAAGSASGLTTKQGKR
jgi:hypothetical protein